MPIRFCLIVAACAGAAAACAPAFQARVVPAFDRALCAFQPEDGERALTGDVGAERPADSGYFGKRYNRTDLEAVLSASAIETARYAQLMGVSLFAAPSTQIPACPMFASLPVVGGRAQSVWQEASAAAGGGELVGLYFENSDGPPDRSMRRPTIVVSMAADRWTLVHEQLHHSFNRERKRDAVVPTSAELASDVERAAASASSAAQSARTEAGLERYADALGEAGRSFNELLERTLFEEIAVEGLMLDEWSAGRLRFVSDQAALNAAAYASLAREAGLASLNDVGRRSELARTQAAANGWTAAAESAGRNIRFLTGVRDRTAAIAARLRTLALAGPRKFASPAQPAARRTTRAGRFSADGVAPERPLPPPIAACGAGRGSPDRDALERAKKALSALAPPAPLAPH